MPPQRSFGAGKKGHKSVGKLRGCPSHYSASHPPARSGGTSGGCSRYWPARATPAPEAPPPPPASGERSCRVDLCAGQGSSSSSERWEGCRGNRGAFRRSSCCGGKDRHGLRRN